MEIRISWLRENSPFAAIYFDNPFARKRRGAPVIGRYKFEMSHEEGTGFFFLVFGAYYGKELE